MGKMMNGEKIGRKGEPVCCEIRERGMKSWPVPRRCLRILFKNIVPRDFCFLYWIQNSQKDSVYFEQVLFLFQWGIFMKSFIDGICMVFIILSLIL